jgi:acyl dehydratase
MEQLSFKDFELNKVFDFGFITLTEQEIIDFAKVYDPLDFHINKELAEKSMFRGLIASGPHLFHVLYITKWLPLFKDSVLGGREVNWKFLKPIYANMKVYCKATIAELKPNAEKNYAIIKWHYDFTNEKGDFFQTIDITVMHSMT